MSGDISELGEFFQLLQSTTLVVGILRTYESGSSSGSRSCGSSEGVVKEGEQYFVHFTNGVHALKLVIIRDFSRVKKAANGYLCQMLVKK